MIAYSYGVPVFCNISHVVQIKAFHFINFTLCEHSVSAGNVRKDAHAESRHRHITMRSVYMLGA